MAKLVYDNSDLIGSRVNIKDTEVGTTTTWSSNKIQQVTSTSVDITETTTVTPVYDTKYVVKAEGATITVDSTNTIIGTKITIFALYDCTLVYGDTTKTLPANTVYSLAWGGSIWIETVSSTYDSTSLNPVNGVALNSALINSNSYSLDEVDTNKTWIDNSKIYRKVFLFKYSTPKTTSFNEELGITFSKIIIINTRIYSNNLILYNTYYGNTTGVSIWGNSTNSLLGINVQGYEINEMDVIVEYIK